jgi:esterase/lipase
MRTALILHGWPGLSKGDWELIHHLKTIGYEVVVPELFSDDFVPEPEYVFKYVAKKINGKSLDLGVGISMGGLILPYFAERYPGMKMVFVASGPNLNTDLKLFNTCLKLIRNKYVFNFIMMFFYKMPLSVVVLFYKILNPFNGPAKLRDEYIADMTENIEKIRRISKTKQAEVLHYVVGEDNRARLQGLKNNSLIIAGENDLLMPKRGSEMLAKLLVNSKLIVNNGSHLNVFNKESLGHIDKFIN